MVESILGGSVLNYVGHKVCVRKASQMARRTKMSVELAKIFKQQNKARGQERHRLHRATRNGAWMRAVPHHLNGMELSW